MRNPRSVGAPAGAIVLAMAVGACSSGGGSSSTRTGTSTSTGTSGGSLTTINIGEVPFYANIPLALGEKVGIFAHYGLQVNLQPASNVNDIIPNLQSWNQPLGLVSPSL